MLLVFAGLMVSGIWTVLLWLGALAALGNTVAVANSHPCPHCGAEIELESGKLKKCEHCHQYARRDRQDTYAVFGALVPPEYALPEQCCVCGDAASRTLEFEAERSALLKNLGILAAGLSVGVAVVSWGGNKKIVIEVPHCDDHEDGVHVELDPPSIFFRSQNYRDTFCGENHATPV